MSEELKLSNYLTPEMIKEYRDEFRQIRKAYADVKKGYSDREQLQAWRQALVFIYAEFAEETNRVSGSKIFYERQKDTVRAEEFLRIKEDAKSKTGKKSDTAIKEEIGATDAYKNWAVHFSKAYGSWEGFKAMLDSIKLIIDSISSHLRNIQTSNYTDPK